MKIRITNPKPGSSKFTSQDRADRYVRLGDAILIGNELTFLSHSERRQMQNIEDQISASERRCSDVYVTRQVWWNGDIRDEFAMRRPGEVRS